MKSELSNDLEETIVALMMKPRELDAKLLHDAIAVRHILNNGLCIHCDMYT